LFLSQFGPNAEKKTSLMEALRRKNLQETQQKSQADGDALKRLLTESKLKPAAMNKLKKEIENRVQTLKQLKVTEPIGKREKGTHHRLFFPI
jgi:hypothetical protein